MDLKGIEYMRNDSVQTRKKEEEEEGESNIIDALLKHKIAQFHPYCMVCDLIFSPWEKRETSENQHGSVKDAIS